MVLLDHLNMKCVILFVLLMCLQHVCSSVYLIFSVRNYNINGHEIERKDIRIIESPNLRLAAYFCLNWLCRVFHNSAG